MSDDLMMARLLELLRIRRMAEQASAREEQPDERYMATTDALEAAIALLKAQAIYAQTSAQATRNDSVVVEGVTLPVGEKPALMHPEHFALLEAAEAVSNDFRDDSLHGPDYVTVSRTGFDLLMGVLEIKGFKEAASRDLNTHLHDAAGLRPVAEKPYGAYCCSTPCVCGQGCGSPCRHGVTKGDHCPDCEAMKE